ncbi:TFIIA-alpha and beta-like factor [Gallus gallus]|uniref:TFIIA-alpha and beta-like factor n=2 Tax=Gallus gallus TaxID=9031 RepID=UPI0000610540|nr:TFIIA-alpha and beta-like factor [Gallus gallus]|eukprot:NP_001191795.1 TFIIA-alpha and beta-like factor [Gallus gallus]
MAHGNPVPKLYKSVIEDVIESIQGLFAEEGVDKQVLRNLKELWETKVMQSKATEGLFKHSHHSSHLTVQFPHNFHHVLQASTASFVIPTGGGFQHFMAADLGASQKGATLTFPSSVAYPIHVPAGLTLQTASGQLYKVNMPVMVAHGQGDASILQHPLQQVFQPIGQPSVLKTNLATVAPVRTSSVQATAEILQTQKTEVQQTVVFQPSAFHNKHPENSTNTVLFQQPAVSQQEIATNAVLNQCAELTEKSQYSNLHTAVFTSGSSEVFSPAESLANDPGSVLLPDVEGQLDMKPQESVQQQVSGGIIELIIKGKSLDGNAALKDQDSEAPTDKMEPTEQVESDLQSEKGICSDTEGIIQLDGTCDGSPKKEVLHTKDTEENEFIDIIESEDLKILEDEEDEEADSISNSESSSSCDNEEPQTDVVEEDPLNSDDDVSDLDIADLFDTNNVIVCQYEKIHRSKNKWKFFLKDGVMSFNGKDYVFAKAVGDAEW